MTLEEADKIISDGESKDLVRLIENGSEEVAYLAAVVRAILFKIESLREETISD